MADVDQLVERMLAELKDRLTNRGHRAIVVQHEHRGHCPPREEAPGCIRLRGLIADAERYLAVRWLDGRKAV